MSAPQPSPTYPAAPFAQRRSIEQVEEGLELAPKFDRLGLIPVVTTDADRGEVLMVGVVDAEALARTIATRQAHYWSRSRQASWHKGATSGFVQHVVEARIDDDQDAVWLRVRLAPGQASCHVGYRSCFYRAIDLDDATRAPVGLVPVGTKKIFDPETVYGGAPNPTRL